MDFIETACPYCGTVHVSAYAVDRLYCRECAVPSNATHKFNDKWLRRFKKARANSGKKRFNYWWQHLIWLEKHRMTAHNGHLPTV